jgi:hypothetical protein
VIANTRAKLDELVRNGVTQSLKTSEVAGGKALWAEVGSDFMPGVELPDDQGFYTFFTRQSFGDLYYRCAKFAAQANRPVTAYGGIDRKWPVWSFEGYRPGSFYIAGVDPETWAFCQERLRPGTDPDWYSVAPGAPGVVSFAKLLNSRAQGADVRRMNISGTYQIKLMPNPLEQDPSRGVAVQTNLGWEPIVEGSSKDDMNCLIDKAKDGGTAELSAFQSVDRATGLHYLKLVRLEEVCIRHR